jgi:ZIP family zinc transporter
MPLEWLADLHPVAQAFLGGVATWTLTALGAALVLATRHVGARFLDGLMGCASGIMIAASFWSLLAPAIELSRASGAVSWRAPLIGFLSGGAFLWLMNRVLPHLHPGAPLSKAEGPHTSWQRSVLLVLAITLHNIPEGLAVGVSYAAVAQGVPTVTLGAAVALTIGIGLQNVPEGLAVAMPLRTEGVSGSRSFFWGQLSAAVEPVAAVVGAAAIGAVSGLLPYALAFAAGAMIYVVVEELVPASHTVESHKDVATVGVMLGFAVMMVLDVALG